MASAPKACRSCGHEVVLIRDGMICLYSCVNGHTFSFDPEHEATTEGVVAADELCQSPTVSFVLEALTRLEKLETKRDSLAPEAGSDRQALSSAIDVLRMMIKRHVD
jgi:hypothetical protein